jgi:hypothetical protein
MYEDNLNDVFEGYEPTGVTATVVGACVERTPPAATSART